MNRGMVAHVATQFGVDNLCRRHAAASQPCVLRRLHRGRCLPPVDAVEVTR